MNQVIISAPELNKYIASIFVQAGAAPTEGDAIATNLVDTNLAGHDSHGVVRVQRYVEYAKQGHMYFGRTAELISESDAFSLLDGKFGFGQTLGHEAVNTGLRLANEAGVSVVALRCSGHLGRIGAWAEKAAAAGFVSVHFVNVARSTLVAPFGGIDRRMSTAPFTVGIPNGEEPFILDFATSRVAEGKVLVAQQGGPEAPDGSLIDAEGRLTNRPFALYGNVAEGSVPDPRMGPGALVAMGDHKGSGLALACELLAGALTGSGTTGPGDGAYNGMLSFYLDPQRIDDTGSTGEAIANYVEWVRAARSAVPGDPVLIPGDKERITRQRRLAEGIPLSKTTWKSIVDTAGHVGLTEIPKVKETP